MGCRPMFGWKWDCNAPLNVCVIFSNVSIIENVSLDFAKLTRFLVPIIWSLYKNMIHIWINKCIKLPGTLGVLAVTLRSVTYFIFSSNTCGSPTLHLPLPKQWFSLCFFVVLLSLFSKFVIFLDPQRLCVQGLNLVWNNRLFFPETPTFRFNLMILNGFMEYGIMSFCHVGVLIVAFLFLQGYFNNVSEYLRIGPPLYFVVKNYNYRYYIVKYFLLCIFSDTLNCFLFFLGKGHIKFCLIYNVCMCVALHFYFSLSLRREVCASWQCSSYAIDVRRLLDKTVLRF